MEVVALDESGGWAGRIPYYPSQMICLEAPAAITPVRHDDATLPYQIRRRLYFMTRTSDFKRRTSGQWGLQTAAVLLVKTS